MGETPKVEPIIEPKENTPQAVVPPDAELIAVKISPDQPIHYATESGKLAEIDTNIIVDETKDYTYRNAAGPFTFRAAANLAGGVEYTNKEGEVCRFALGDVEGAVLNRNSVGVRQGNKIIYPSIYTEADLEFTVLPDMVRTEVVAHTKAARKNSYTFDVFACEIPFQKPTAQNGLGQSTRVTDASSSATIKKEILDEATGETKSEIQEVQTLTISVDYNALDKQAQKAIEEVKNNNPVDAVKDIFASKEQKEAKANQVQEVIEDAREIRIDPSLGTWIYSTNVDKTGLAKQSSLLYSVGTIGGHEDGRIFYHFNRDAMPMNGAYDILGGYFNMYVEESNGDTTVEVFGTRFGDLTPTFNQVIERQANLAYPGVGDKLTDYHFVDQSGAKTTTPADRSAVPQFDGVTSSNIKGWRRVHVPWWVFYRWRYAGPSGWFSSEGLMIKAKEGNKGFKFRTSLDAAPSLRPSITVFMSSDGYNPDRGNHPSVPDIYMPRSGSYIDSPDGKRCDESVVPSVGPCRTLTEAAMVTGAGDRDGYGPGDMLGVQYQVWGDTPTQTPFIYGTSPGITAFAKLQDGVNYWAAYSKDRTNRTSNWTPNQVLVTDTTPPSVPVLSTLPEYTRGVGLDSVRQVDLNSEGSYDEVNLRVLATMNTFYDIGYLMQYSTDPTFVSNVYQTGWQANNSDFNLSQYGADQIAGNADDLKENTKYFFRMKSKDNFGNISAWSNVVSTNLDSIKPVITSSAFDPLRVSTIKNASASAAFTETNPASSTLDIVQKLNVVPSASPTPTPTPTFTQGAPLSIALGGIYYYNGQTLTIDGETYLFAGTNNSYLSKFRVRDMALITHIPLSSPMFSITFDGTYLVGITQSGYLTYVNPANNTVVKQTYVGVSSSYEVRYFDGYFWASRYEDNRVTKIDPATGAQLCSAKATATVGGQWAINVKVLGGKLWVTDYANGYLFQINTTNCATSVITPKFNTTLWDVIEANGSLWALTYNGLYKVDPTTGAILTSVPLENGAMTVNYDGKYFWINYYNSTTIKALDPAQNYAVVKTFTGNGIAAYKARTDGRYIVYIYYENGGKFTRIDTGRWYEPNAPPSITTQNIPAPTTIDLKSKVGGGSVVASRSTTATFGGVKYIYTALLYKGALTRTKFSDPTDVTVIQLDKSKFTNVYAMVQYGDKLAVISFEGWLGIINPSTGAVEKSYQVFPVAAMTDGVAFFDNAFFVGAYYDNTIKKIRPSDGATLCSLNMNTIGGGQHASLHLQVIGGALYSQHLQTGRLVKIDANCKIVGLTSQLGFHPGHYFFDGKNIVVTNNTLKKVFFIDPKTMQKVKEFTTDLPPVAGAFDGKNYWISTNSSPMYVIKYDSNFKELARIGMTNGETLSYDAMSVDGGVWITNWATASISRFDPKLTAPVVVAPSEMLVDTRTVSLPTNATLVKHDFDTKTSTGSAILDGPYVARLGVTDKAGQVAQSEKVIVVDNSPASITLSNSLATGWVKDTSVLLQGQLGAVHTAGREDLDVSSFTYSFSGGASGPVPYDPQKIFNTTVSAPQGVSTLTLKTADDAGNTATMSATIHTDSVAPSITNVTPTDLVIGTKPTVSFTLTETTTGSNLRYGTNPNGIAVTLKYTASGVNQSKTILSSGVLSDPTLTSAITCTPSSGATLTTDNGTPLASRVDCSFTFLKDLPDNNYTLDISASDYVGNIVTTSTSFTLKSRVTHDVTTPTEGSYALSPSVTVTGTTTRGVFMAFDQQTASKSATIALMPDMNNQNPDPTVFDAPFTITCGLMQDTDTNPATPDEELCDWTTKIKSEAPEDDHDLENTLVVKAGDKYGNNSTKTIHYIVNPYKINLSVQPVNGGFSPNGDGVVDGVTFETTIDQSVPVTSWTLAIAKKSDGSLVRTFSGTGSLPTSIYFDGKDGAGEYVPDGAYTWSFSLLAQGITFTLPKSGLPNVLTAVTKIDNGVVLLSPADGYVSGDGVVSVSGLVPVSAKPDEMSDKSFKGELHVRLCVDAIAVSMPSACDSVTKVDVNPDGTFSTLVVLPRDPAAQKTNYQISAFAYDEYGNTTPTSAPVSVITDSTGAISYASSTILVPSTPSDKYSAFVGGTAGIDTISSVLVKVTVSQHTSHLKLSYADYTIRDGLYLETGTNSQVIGYVNDQIESDTKKNPVSDSKVKHLHSSFVSLPAGKTCTNATGCDWYVMIPVSNTQSGVYDVTLQAVKGGLVTEASVGYKVDASLPMSPKIMLLDQSVDGSFVRTLEYKGVPYVRSNTVKLYGAGDPGSHVQFKTGDQVLPVSSGSATLQSVIIPQTGIFEVTADITGVTTATGSGMICKTSGQSPCKEGTFEIKPISFEVNPETQDPYNQTEGYALKVGYDSVTPSATKITGTTAGEYIVSPYGRSATPITYDIETSDPASFAQIQRPDTFTRIFDTASSENAKFTATFNMEKNSATDSASITPLDREGYFNPVISILDYAGNKTTYDATKYADYALGDFRGKIDDSKPVTARIPFSLWGDGGKKAADASSDENAVYIHRMAQGFVTRVKTIKIKGQIEKGTRAQFVVNSVPTGLIQSTDTNCTVPTADTLSSETTTADGLVQDPVNNTIYMPTTDRKSKDGLTVRSASLCEVSTTYTFSSNGQTKAEDGTPQESMEVQLKTFDNAGSQSETSGAVRVYYDTMAPMTPTIELDTDDITIRGERNTDYQVTITSPSGVTTMSSDVRMLTPDGFSPEINKRTLNEEFGTFTIRTTTWDSVGNKSEVTRTVERTEDLPDPQGNDYGEGGLGGGGNGGSGVGMASMSVQLTRNGYTVDTNIPDPRIDNANFTSGNTFAVTGGAVASGQSMRVSINLSDDYVNSRIDNYHCAWANNPIGKDKGHFFLCTVIYHRLYDMGIQRRKYTELQKIQTANLNIYKKESYFNSYGHTSSTGSYNLKGLSAVGISNGDIIGVQSAIAGSFSAEGKTISYTNRTSGTSKKAIYDTSYVQSMNLNVGSFQNKPDIAAVGMSSYLMRPADLNDNDCIFTTNGGRPVKGNKVEDQPTECKRRLQELMNTDQGGYDDHRYAYNRWTLYDPRHSSIPQSIKDIYSKATNWNPTVYPQDYIECVAFVVMSYALAGKQIAGNLPNADQWKNKTNEFNVYTSGQSTTLPAVGDLAVWDEMHIGVITGVDYSNNLFVVHNANVDTKSQSYGYSLINGKVKITSVSSNYLPDHWLRAK